MKTKTILSLLCVVILCFASTPSGSRSNLLSAGSALFSALDKIPEVSQFTKLLKTPGLEKMLGGVMDKPFTLLAPTNDALSSLGSAGMASLASPTNISKLADLVKNQIIPGKLNADDLMKTGLKSAAGKAVEVGSAQLGKLVSGDKFNILPINKLLG